jgi:hypothetical protein
VKLGGVSGRQETTKNKENPMNSKSIVKFVLETLVCMAVGLAIAVIFYNAL